MIDANDATLGPMIRTGISLVAFSAQWCGPCKLLHPRVEAAAKKFPRVKSISVDIDSAPKLVQAMGLKKVPTLIIFKTGIEVARREGLVSEAVLVDLLSTYADASSSVS